MNAPTFDAFGNYYRLVWVKEKLAIDVERVRETRDGHLSGEAKITTSATGYNPLLHRSVYSLSNQNSRNQLARALTEKYSDLADWTVVLEQVYWLIADHYRAGEPVMFGGNSNHPTDVSYLLFPILQSNQPTLLYGEGAAGKSYLAAWIALTVQQGHESYLWHPQQAIVLYLDWETDFSTFSSRIKKLKAGAGFPEDITIRYRRCWQSLADDVENIKKIVEEHGVSLIVVDSCGGACGGDPNLPEPVDRFFKALRYLGKASLNIHHVPKSATDKSYGSVYFYNWSRQVFMVRKSEDNDEYEMNVGLFHKKANEGPATEARGFNFRFTDESVVVNHKDASDVADFISSMRNPAKIESVLKALGRANLDTLTEEIGVDKEVTAATLRRMVRNGKVVKIDKDYGLPSERIVS